MFGRYFLRFFLPFFVIVSAFCVSKPLSFSANVHPNCAQENIQSSSSKTDLPYFFANPSFDSQDENEDEDHEKSTSSLESPILFTFQTSETFTLSKNKCRFVKLFCTGRSIVPTYILLCCLRICQ